MDKAVGKISCTKKKDGRTGKPYEMFWVVIPQKLVKDPNFPFKAEDQVIIRIEGKQLTIQALR